MAVPIPPARSLIIRLLAPVAIMLGLIAGVQALDAAARHKIVAADASVIAAQSHVFRLAELRSISRSLQRDALNLVTEPDATALAEIGARFDKRRDEFAQLLAAFAQDGEAAGLDNYVATQTDVLAELGAVRRRAVRDRAGALATFRRRVRPAERHASAIADRAIDTGQATVGRTRISVTTTQRDEGRELTAICLLLTALAVAVASYMIVATILRPLAEIRRAMERLAQGDADEVVPHVHRGDEIGAMARSIQIFRAAAIERDRLRAERAFERQDALEREGAAAGQRTLETQRKRLLADLATAVESNLTAVNDKLRASADRLSGSADAVSRQAGDAASEAERTAEAARGAAADLLSVTSTGVRLADTIGRLREQAADAADAIGRASARSQVAGARVATLTDHADRVSGMAENIRAVAFRSRLLALNATIEAARVGEAGKGFAVVAGEIKALAVHTAAVTHQVEEQAGSIRHAATEAVAALVEIEKAIALIARDAAAVGAAMTQQGEAGAEIGAGMRTALTQVEEVAARMGELRDTATATGAVAGVLEADASALGADASSVDAALRTLVGDLRAAA